MNRAERRAASRRVKGGAPAGASPKHLTDEYGAVLKTYAEAGERIRIGKALRSKQVPGF